MGQYYLIVNIDKKEYLLPHKFGDGLKAREFISGDTGKGLIALLLKTSEGGGGDLTNMPYTEEERAKSPIGSWAGDRIVITGDYDGDHDTKNLYDIAEEEYKDVSVEILQALIDGHEFSKEELEEHLDSCLCDGESEMWQKAIDEGKYW